MAWLLQIRDAVAMAPALRLRGVVLVAQQSSRTLASTIEKRGYSVAMVTTSAEAISLARELRPDVIVLGSQLADVTGVEACQALRGDPFVARSVPILLVVEGSPTPEQRVTAVRAGAWDFLQVSDRPDAIAMKVDTCVLAKRNIDEAIATDLVTPDARLYTSDALAREARRLGALMTRVHGAIACVVFEWTDESPDPATGVLVARAVRTSDAVGALSPRRFAIVAPGTDSRGAVKLATRLGESVRSVVDELATRRGASSTGLRVIAGYDAVANVRYAPIDPVGLIASATAAVRNGTPDPEALWVRGHGSYRHSLERLS
jgi:CheY-like chemotaxis protein